MKGCATVPSPGHPCSVKFESSEMTIGRWSVAVMVASVVDPLLAEYARRGVETITNAITNDATRHTEPTVVRYVTSVIELYALQESINSGRTQSFGRFHEFPIAGILEINIQ